MDNTTTNSEPKYKKIADTISGEIKHRGISRKEFAGTMGVQPSIITRWLSGKHNFTLDTLVRIEEVMGITLFTNENRQKDNRRICAISFMDWFLMWNPTFSKETHRWTLSRERLLGVDSEQLYILYDLYQSTWPYSTSEDHAGKQSKTAVKKDTYKDLPPAAPVREGLRWVKASEELPPINKNVVICENDGRVYKDIALTGWDKNVTDYSWLDESPASPERGEVEVRKIIESTIEEARRSEHTVFLNEEDWTWKASELADDTMELLQPSSEQRAEQWVSVKDKMPDDVWTECLVWCDGHYGHPTGLFTVKGVHIDPVDKGARGIDAWNRPILYITHWMPLPNKPKL